MAYINLLEIIHPVGSMWISSINTSPAEIVGGSWTRIEDARFLMAANGTRYAGEAGGANDITLTVNQMPSHNHTTSKWVLYDTGVLTSSNGRFTPAQNPYDTSFIYNNGIQVSNTGGGQSHSNIPAYYTMYMWVRTA